MRSKIHAPGDAIWRPIAFLLTRLLTGAPIAVAIATARQPVDTPKIAPQRRRWRR